MIFLFIDYSSAHKGYRHQLLSRLDLNITMIHGVPFSLHTTKTSQPLTPHWGGSVE